MKTTVKTIWKTVIATLFFVIAIGANDVQAQEKTVYGFGYAYSYDTKTLYISNTVNGVIDSDTYYDATENGLKIQWRKKMEIEDSKSYNYSVMVYGFSTNKTGVEEYRTETIGKFKKQEFSIQYVSFSFTKEKRD